MRVGVLWGVMLRVRQKDLQRWQVVVKGTRKKVKVATSFVLM
jgi:hypothetical protein